MKTEVEMRAVIVIDIEITSARYEPGGGDRGGRSIPIWKEMLGQDTYSKIKKLLFCNHMQIVILNDGGG